MSKNRCADCIGDIDENRLEAESLQCPHPECEEGPLCKRCLNDHLFFHQTAFEMVD